jgi:hypothetical protein
MDKKALNKTTGNPAKSTIKCECGAEIPFNSDWATLSKAIEAHAETHRNVERDCSKTDAANEGEAELEVERIKDELTAQASKIGNHSKQRL